MTGKISKGVGGFYYVDVPGEGVIECRARGIFRKEGKKPLVGDDVQIHITDPKDREGSLDHILPRRNQLIRPAAANVDQALVVFALASPAPHLNLLDRFLICMKQQQVPVVIAFNKTDLAEEAEAERCRQIYEGSGCRVLTVSVLEEKGLEELKELLRGKTTIVAGPSGVGKSSLTNYLQPEANMETGVVSERIERGRHTTRHTQLIRIGEDTYFLDTPGFSTIYLTDMDERDLHTYYEEFSTYEGNCRFQGCLHHHEPDCAVKAALAQGVIPQERYENYIQLLEELRSSRGRGG